MKNRVKHITLFLFLSLMALSCSKESDIGGREEPKLEREVTVTLSLNIPAMPTTRGVAGNSEESVKTVDVLVFDKGDKFVDWQFGYLQQGAEGTIFYTKLRGSTDDDDKYRLMVLANSRLETLELFDAADLGGREGQSYSQIQKLLTTELSIDSEEQLKRGIPMWAETEDGVVLSEENNTLSMTLIRALARMDVGTNPKPAYDGVTKLAEYSKLENFSLEEVILFNTIKEVAIAPDRAKFNFTADKVTDITLPESITVFSERPTYKEVERDAGIGYCMRGKIYTTENDVKMADGATYGDVNHFKRPAIIVGGLYSGDGATGKMSYYRIDILDNKESSKITNLHRNYGYQVVIKSVSGPGQESPEEAFKTHNAEVEADVIGWSPSELANTVVDGQYRLSLDEIKLELSKWRKDETGIEVTTNYPTGWSAALGDDKQKWLTLNGAVDGVVSSGTSGTLTFAVTGNEGVPRTTHIYISAGRMTNKVEVTQLDKDDEFYIRLSESEMLFTGRMVGGGDIPSQELRIDYGPSKHAYDMYLTTYTNGGIKGLTLPKSSTRLLHDIKIDPMTDEDIADDIFFERSSRLKVEVHDLGETETIYRQVVIKQRHYALEVENVLDHYMVGYSHEFNVRSNTNWVATVDDPKGILAKVGGTVGEGITNVTEKALIFKISQNAKDGDEATITFRSEDGLFAEQTYPIIARTILPNSYMIKPGESQTIPVKKAYRMWTTDIDLKEAGIPDNGTLGVKLLWQDQPDMITSLSSLSGSGEDAEFTVSTKSGVTGNALVAFTIDGDVYWSWHLWVTDYDPELNNASDGKYTLMDRNLGALNDIEGDMDNWGMFYQELRKDPIPRYETRTNGESNPRIKIYDINGNVLVPNQGGLDTETMAPGDVNLIGSIRNPMTQYIGVYGNLSWYGSLVPLKQTMWGGQNKWEYDPCPEGWKIASDNAFDGKRGRLNEITKGLDIDSYGYFPIQGKVGVRGQLYLESYLLQAWVTSRDDGARLVRNSSGSTTIWFGTSGRPTEAYPLRCMKDDKSSK